MTCVLYFLNLPTVQTYQRSLYKETVYISEFTQVPPSSGTVLGPLFSPVHWCALCGSFCLRPGEGIAVGYKVKSFLSIVFSGDLWGEDRFLFHRMLTSEDECYPCVVCDLAVWVFVDWFYSVSYVWLPNFGYGRS